MFSLMLLAIVAISCSAACLVGGSATVTENKKFQIQVGGNSACTTNSWIYVSFSCGKTLTFKQKISTSPTTSPLTFNCSHFYSSTNDPNLICDFYQCQSFNGQSVVKATYKTTQNAKLKAGKLAQNEEKTLTLQIEGELTPPEEVDTKDKNLLTIVIISVIVIIVLIVVFVVFCILCKKKRTQTDADAAQKIDAAYREHPKNEMLIDIVKRQKRYDDSENTDEFYVNTGDSGALAVASDKIKTRGSKYGGSVWSKANRSHTIESEDGSLMISDGKLHSSSRVSFHDESFTINRVLKPATGNLDLTDSD